MTFVLKVNISKALQRLKKRITKKNRYDKFSKNFYIKAQKAFIKIAKKNKKKYYIFDNSENDKNLEKNIFKLVRAKLIK
jgi:thymidylate kinase